MSEFVQDTKRRILVIIVLSICCLLILCCILYPSFRYEEASIGKTEIRHDRFTDVIYLKDSPSPKAEWIPTKYKNIMEAKYSLAEKELEEAFKEVRKTTQQKRRNRVNSDEIRVIPASPYD